MDKRYRDKRVARLWSLANRLAGFQVVENAAIEGDVNLGLTPKEAGEVIIKVLRNKRISIKYYEEQDKLLRHDLNAFLAERRRYIPVEYQQYFHRNMTSYDTQEPAMALRLKASALLVKEGVAQLVGVLIALIKKYRYTPMVGRTHGQGAELQSFGFRCIRYHQQLELVYEQLEMAELFLDYSKMSGAIGNYTERTMEQEEEALRILGLTPFYGASQIMPRVLYLPLISAMRGIGMVLGQIAMDVRLGARSSCPIYQEFFGASQMGSSAMPHKRNPINAEGEAGLLALLYGYLMALESVVVTWEERAIEQSSTERVAWADAFHIVVYSLGRMSTLLEKLRVYPENMLREIADMHGCYATAKLQDLIKELGAPFGLDAGSAYRIVQLAAFNVTPQPNADAEPPASLEEAEEWLRRAEERSEEVPPVHISEVIRYGQLQPSDVLQINPVDITNWNSLLREIFAEESTENNQRLTDAFALVDHLAGEEEVYLHLYAGV